MNARNSLRNNIGTFAGFLIFAVLTTYEIFSNSPQKGLEMVSTVSGALVASTIVLGGAISGFIIQNFIVRKFSTRGGLWGAVLGGIMVSHFSLETGVIFGTLGGSIGDIFGETAGYAGILLTIAVTIASIECASAAICAFIGSRIISE